MFSKITQALILSGCLAGAGVASADERNMIVPIIAGAAVGAVLASVIGASGRDDEGPREPPPPPRGYEPQPRPVAYAPRLERHRFDPPPPPRRYDDDDDRGDRGPDHGFDYNHE